MSVCKLEDQVNWLGELVCAWLIVNERMHPFEPLKISIPLLVATWIITIFSTSRVLRVVCRGLALAFALCFIPLPILIPIPMPAWPFLLIRHSDEYMHNFAWPTFIIICAISVLVLGMVEAYRKTKEVNW